MNHGLKALLSLGPIAILVAALLVSIKPSQRAITGSHETVCQSDSDLANDDAQALDEEPAITEFAEIDRTIQRADLTQPEPVEEFKPRIIISPQSSGEVEGMRLKKIDKPNPDAKFGDTLR